MEVSERKNKKRGIWIEKRRDERKKRERMMGKAATKHPSRISTGAWKPSRDGVLRKGDRIYKQFCMRICHSKIQKKNFTNYE